MADNLTPPPLSEFPVEISSMADDLSPAQAALAVERASRFPTEQRLVPAYTPTTKDEPRSFADAATNEPPRERGAWMQTFTGRAFFLQTPSPHDIDIRDIAQSLAQLCRFFGHCNAFYSVAQHSVIVSEIAVDVCPAVESGDVDPKEVALAGLLHDAPEAYVGDIIAPLKLLLPDYGSIERRVSDAVAARFAIRSYWPANPLHAVIMDAVKLADRIAVATERRDLMARGAFIWTTLPEPHPTIIEPWEPNEARARFLARFHALTESN